MVLVMNHTLCKINMQKGVMSKSLLCCEFCHVNCMWATFCGSTSEMTVYAPYGARSLNYTEQKHLRDK